MSAPRFDRDGDVDMNPQPVFEFVKAPRLTAWDQATLAKWNRDRRQYERRIEERCATIGESASAIMVSVRSTVEPRLLEHLSRYVHRMDEDLLTDDDIMETVNGRCNQLQNQHIIPDIDDLFRRGLRMNMNESDVEARVVHYFGQFDRIVEERGLGDLLGTTSTSTAEYKQKMKERCRLLIANMEPPTLKTEIQRLVGFQYRPAKASDIELFDLVLLRAKEQHHHFLMDAESNGRRRAEPREKNAARVPQQTQPAAQPSRVARAAERTETTQAQAPRTGCWFCKGDHWLRECPTASEADKKAAVDAMKKVKSARRVAVKAVRAAGSEPGCSMVIVNDVFELPFVADTALTVISSRAKS